MCSYWNCDARSWLNMPDKGLQVQMNATIGRENAEWQKANADKPRPSKCHYLVLPLSCEARLVLNPDRYPLTHTPV